MGGVKYRVLMGTNDYTVNVVFYHNKLFIINYFNPRCKMRRYEFIVEVRPPIEAEHPASFRDYLNSRADEGLEFVSSIVAMEVDYCVFKRERV